MAFSKPSSFIHRFKSLPLPYYHHHHHRTFHPHPPALISFRRLLSFATPDDIAAERRKRRRQVRMQPPLSPARHQQQQQPQQPRSPITNPNAPKIPEHVFALTGSRLSCHNKILQLIRENDLDEAALYTRHSVYSNCRPTIFTCNAVLSALLRQTRYSDFLSLHRFITQAGIGSNIITYNLLITLYCECRKPDTALEHYKRLIEDAPFDPSPTTYRILVKGLVDNNRVEKAIEIKDEMLSRAFVKDAVVYGYLMNGCARNKDGDKVLELYEELRGECEPLMKGIIYGPLMKGYFLKGLEEEAMRVFEEVMHESSQIKMDAVAFNLVLDAFCKHGKFDEALKLFEKMKSLHNPPWKLTVNLGSYNVMVDGYCAEGKFEEAVDLFMSMGEKNCSPDILSFNNLIEQLCNNGLLPKGEELCEKMSEEGVNPDEVTYCLLMDSCFKENRSDDAAGYYSKMIEANLRPNLAVYNKLVEGLVQVGKIDEAKSFFDLMVKKLKFNSASYEFMFKALCDVGKVDDVLKIVSDMLDEGSVDLNEDMHKIVKDGLKSEGREEEELDRLIEQKEKEKEEAKRREAEEAERAKASARAAVASLIPSKLFGNKEDGKEPTTLSGSEDTISNSEMQAGEKASAASASGLTAETVTEGHSAAESAFKSVDSAQATA